MHIYTCRLRSYVHVPVFFLCTRCIAVNRCTFDRNSRIVGVPVAWRGRADQGVWQWERLLSSKWGGTLRIIGFRAFFSWLRVYCSSPMVGTEAYRVAFERGNREGGACSLRDGTIGWVRGTSHLDIMSLVSPQRGPLLCAPKVPAEYIVGGTHARTTSFGDLRRRCRLHCL